ncbi:LAQU0S01e00958g1_1 [Lachancea quebecensis]|uniref:DNA-(apurinic or apyrimidinic site) lyase n=1 Tax=Lachancea quebecensis TaxID=1654605 RepID=A0A0P1KNS4_9SACH|nr:LAQU0S01e00958g1_1 [Lachancea quebecensis]
MLKFQKLLIKRGELYLDNVLQCGQAFRWIFHEELGQYSTTMRIDNRFKIIVLRQLEDTYIEYASLGTEECLGLGDFLKKYFRLEVPLSELYENQWLPQDPRFEKKRPQGIRILSQDPWETLLSYICSSNNNISRITKMCHLLCNEFGNPVGQYDKVDYYSFPTSKELVERASEEKLRALGFGYRAKFLMKTADKMLKERLEMSDSQCLESWKDHLEYEQVREKVMGFDGVGPKVADCVCLSGLEMDEVVPVDVHIARIAQRDYKFAPRKQDIEELQIRYKNLPITRKKVNYELDLIRAMFKEKWGDFAGWAQGIVFAQEVGKTIGATSEGTTSRRKLEVEVKVELQNQGSSVKRELEESVEKEIEYSDTGRPKRKTTKRVEYRFK